MSKPLLPYNLISKGATLKILLSGIITICTYSSYAQSIKIDHIIAVSNNLDSSIAHFSKLGFIVKPGRLHKNGIRNAHIKFRNGSSYEIISIEGEPKDAIARKYITLLEEKEGGVFIAISGLSTAAMINKLDSLNIEYNLIKSKAWNYITFNSTALSHLFFIEYKIKNVENPKFTSHPNAMNSFGNICMDGNDKTLHLLKGLGLKQSLTPYSLSKAKNRNAHFATPTGQIVVCNKDSISSNPRLISVEIISEMNHKTIQFSY